MLHPSYTDLMRVVNSEVEPGEQPVVNSRYSIVIATARRARQIIDGSIPLVDVAYPKPLSIAVEELYRSKVKIVGDDESRENDNQQ
ncbi:MAG: DNA-directed polymerase, omega subunit [Herbinix sp.]|jgi:DNA-directed RNA polymerase subunit omega|nr:DNA-directed polymerase, omega subunit [Herbinix sp.]